MMKSRKNTKFPGVLPVMMLITMLCITVRCSGAPVAGNQDFSRLSPEQKRETRVQPRQINNPAQLAKGILTAKLEEIRRIRASDISGDSAVFHIAASASNGVLLGDFSSHHVYAFLQTTPETPLINAPLTFICLRKGEGPGEIPFGVFSLCWRQNTVWIGAPRKIMRFSSQGHLRDEWKLPRNFRKISIISENLFIGNYPDKEGVYSCSLCDFSGNEKICFQKQPNGGNTAIKTKVNGEDVQVNFSASVVTPDIIHHVSSDGKETAICKTAEYAIFIYSLDGVLHKEIRRGYTPPLLSEAEKTELVNVYFSRELPPVKNAIRDNLPGRLCAVSDIRILPNGFLAATVQTSLKTSIMDIFDKNGIYIFQLQFRGTEGKHYFLMENGHAGMLENTEEGSVFSEHRIVNIPEFNTSPPSSVSAKE